MVSKENVLLYYPNLIGYSRVFFMALSFYFAFSNFKVALIAYSLAFFGDAVDGYIARLYNQSSTFGGVLDMVTDRVSTCGFLIVLSHIYPSFTFHIIMLVVIDISSHWFHVLSVNAHHKSAETLKNRNIILRCYYGIYPLFGYCCVGTEFFYILLYAHHFVPHPLLWKACIYLCFPACLMKQIINIAQLIAAAETIAAKDAELRNSKE